MDGACLDGGRADHGLPLGLSQPHDRTVISRVARQLGVGDESLRSWAKQTEFEADYGHQSQPDAA